MRLIKAGQNIVVVITLCIQAGLLYATPMKEWDSLLQSNNTFVRNSTFAQQRTQLKTEQNPPIIILSCSDSRVPPELIFDRQLGSLFVVRVAGQVIDNVVIDSIEYAVTHFDAHVIVVLGHSNCGAVAAALEHLQKNNGAINKASGHLNAVLIPIGTAILEAGIDIHGAKALEKSIQAHIQYAANQLITRSKTISHAVKSKQLVIVGAEYYLRKGKVKQLFVIPNQKSVKKNIR